jgi:hypothetical protein
MRFQGARHLLDRLQAAANGAGIPAFEVAFARPAALLLPEAAEVLLTARMWQFAAMGNSIFVPPNSPDVAASGKGIYGLCSYNNIILSNVP